MGMVDEATNAEAAAALAPVTAAGTLAQDVAATRSTVAGAAVQAPSLAEWSVNPASTSSRQSGGSSSAAGELDGPAQAIETAGLHMRKRSRKQMLLRLLQRSASPAHVERKGHPRHPLQLAALQAQ